MKKFQRYLQLLILLCSLSVDLYAQNSAPGKNEVSTQTRSLNNFTSISLNVPGSLTVSQSSEFSFRLEARQDVLDQIVTEVKNSELIIKFKDHKWKMPGETSIHISVDLPQLKGLEINGSGDITAQTDITTDKLDLAVNGSGDINLKKVTATELEAEINGSGSIADISGTITKLSMDINGSGDIHADNLNSKALSASIAGSGDISVGNTDDLEANIAGSGDVYYKGNPSNVKKNIAGSGKVSQR